MTSTARQKRPAANSLTPAVLYICAARSREAPGLAEQRAIEEGRSFADKHDLRITTEITDPYGEVDPQKRSGWLRVRDMAERGEVEAVIVRWPNAISPQHNMRHPQVTWCEEQGARVLFSWAPLALLTGLHTAAPPD